MTVYSRTLEGSGPPRVANTCGSDGPDASSVGRCRGSAGGDLPEVEDQKAMEELVEFLGLRAGEVNSTSKGEVSY